VNFKRSTSILDIGSGKVRQTAGLAKSGYTLTGTGLSESQPNIIKEKAVKITF
jgi:hypothetical protein